MSYGPAPGHGAGDFAEGANLANYVDQQYLRLRTHARDHDPEGLLSTLPAIAIRLLVVFAGLPLKNPLSTHAQKLLQLVAGSLACLAIGCTRQLNSPVIQKLWTSSLVLVAGGYNYLLLGAFSQIQDAWNVQKWAMPFEYIALNPITIYFGGRFIAFEGITKLFVGGPVSPVSGPYAEL